ncbi:MAG: hypothetical protein ABGX16_04330, partial [Pirellulales bacterium]
PTARCFRHFVAIAVSKPQPESRALADCRRTLRLQAVVFSQTDRLCWTDSHRLLTDIALCSTTTLSRYGLMNCVMLITLRR